MKSSTLLALSASALALPGISGQAQADAAPTESTVSYRYSSYEEDDLDAVNLLAGSSERYDIDIHQFRLLLPVGENYSLNLNSSVESMSGASPWYTIAGANGEPAVVMSGASISERRRDLIATGRRYLANGTLGLTLGVSKEDDYDSLSVGMDAEHHFNSQLTTVSAGFSYASDDLAPTDAALFNRILDASKNSRSVFVSLTQIIDRNNLLQTGLSATRLSGYLSDPYKLGDRRPDSRTQLSWSTAWRHFVEPANAALHVDYRFYHDNFGISSHTAELAWYQNLGERWKLIPGLRYYSQNAADFFQPLNDFVGTTANSSDYRLSAYGALSTTLTVQVEVADVLLNFSAERYQSGADKGVHDGPASPALVDFTRFGLGFDYSF